MPRDLADIGRESGPEGVRSVLDGPVIPMRPRPVSVIKTTPESPDDEGYEAFLAAQEDGSANDAAPASAQVPAIPFDPTNPLAQVPNLATVALVGAHRLREMAAKPVPYVWQDLVTSAQIVALNGRPGGGKTTLLFLAMVGRANAREPINLLGRELKSAPAGKFVVIVEGEQSEGSSARKLIRSAEALGVGDDALDRIILLARKDVLLGNERWNEVVKLVALGGVSDVGIDSLARVAAAESNDEREQAAIFASFQKLIEGAPGAEEQKPVVWIVTHARKSSDGTSVDDMSGSAQRAAQVDTVINIDPVRDAGRVVASKCHFPKLREEPENPPTPVEFTVSRDARGVWRVTYGEISDGAPHERVHSLLSTKGAMTKTRIREALGLNSDTFEQTLSRLFRERRITKSQKPIAGKMRWVFEAVQAGPPPQATWEEEDDDD